MLVIFVPAPDIILIANGKSRIMLSNGKKIDTEVKFIVGGISAILIKQKK